MSRKPGIGINAVTPKFLVDGIRYFNGVRYTIPRYYFDKLEQQGYNLDFVKLRKKVVAQSIDGQQLEVDDIKKLKKEYDDSIAELYSDI